MLRSRPAAQDLDCGRSASQKDERDGEQCHESAGLHWDVVGSDVSLPQGWRIRELPYQNAGPAVACAISRGNGRGSNAVRVNWARRIEQSREPQGRRETAQTPPDSPAVTDAGVLEWSLYAIWSGQAKGRATALARAGWLHVMHSGRAARCRWCSLAKQPWAVGRGPWAATCVARMRGFKARRVLPASSSGSRR